MMDDLPEHRHQRPTGESFSARSSGSIAAPQARSAGTFADRASRRHGHRSPSLFVWSAVTWLTGHVEDVFRNWSPRRGDHGASAKRSTFPRALALVTEFSSRTHAITGPSVCIKWGSTPESFSAASLGLRGRESKYRLGAGAFEAVRPRRHPLRDPSLRAAQESRRVAKMARLVLRRGAAVRELFGNVGFLLMILLLHASCTPPGLGSSKIGCPTFCESSFHLGQGQAGVFGRAVRASSLRWSGSAWADGWADRWDAANRFADRIFRQLRSGMSFFLPASVRAVGKRRIARRGDPAFPDLVSVSAGDFFDCNNMADFCVRSSGRSWRRRVTAFMNLVSISLRRLRRLGVRRAWRDQTGAAERHLRASSPRTALVSIGIVLLISAPEP